MKTIHKSTFTLWVLLFFYELLGNTLYMPMRPCFATKPVWKVVPSLCWSVSLYLSLSLSTNRKNTKRTHCSISPLLALGKKKTSLWAHVGVCSCFFMGLWRQECLGTNNKILIPAQWAVRDIALSFRITKNLDLSTRPHACLFGRTAHSFACSTLLALLER